jgi:hypothetical protein
MVDASMMLGYSMAEFCAILRAAFGLERRSAQRWRPVATDGTLGDYRIWNGGAASLVLRLPRFATGMEGGTESGLLRSAANGRDCCGGQRERRTA